MMVFIGNNGGGSKEKVRSSGGRSFQRRGPKTPTLKLQPVTIQALRQGWGLWGSNTK